MKSHDPRSVACRLVSLTLLLSSVMLVTADAAQRAGKSRGVGRRSEGMTRLTPGRPVGRVLSGGGAHDYTLRLNAGQFLRVEVLQDGVDVELTLSGPDGTELFKADSPNGTDGPEFVTAIAAATGEHRLKVSAPGCCAFAGRYEVVVRELREARPGDEDRVAAEVAFMAATPFAVAFGEQQSRTAIVKYEESLRLWQKSDDAAGAARALYNIAFVYSALGDDTNAFVYFAQALSQYQRNGDHLGAAKTLVGTGRLHNRRGELQPAVKFFEEALAAYEGLENHLGQARVLVDLADAHRRMGEHEEAFRLYRQALDHCAEALRRRESVEERLVLATVHLGLGATYADSGEPVAAERHLTEALRVIGPSCRREDKLIQAEAHSDLGHTYNTVGRPQEALRHLDQAVPLFREAGYALGLAVALNNTGAVYAMLDDADHALIYYEQALAIYSRLGEQAEGEKAVTLNNVGQTYLLKKEPDQELDQALARFTEALRIQRSRRNQQDIATTLSNIGEVYHLKKDSRRALEYFGQALAIDRRLANRPGMAVVLNNMGRAASALPEEMDKALGYYEEARAIFESLGDRANQATTLGNIGTFYQRRGDKLKALETYRRGIEQLELSRTETTLDEVKAARAEPSAFVALASTLLVEMGQEREAFDLTELARARTLLDRLGNLRPNLFRGKETRLVREEKELSARLLSLEHTLRRERGQAAPSTDVITSTEAKYVAAQREYEVLLTRLKLADPAYASLRSVSPLKLPEVQKLLPEDVTLLSYFVMTEKTLAFVITRDSFKAVEIPVKEEEMAGPIRWFRRFADTSVLQLGELEQLHGWLLAPLRPYIRTRTVGIIPHRLLHYVPFAALTDGRHYFGEEHTLFYLPSASALCFARARSKPLGARMLAVSQGEAEGLPYLAHADAEAEAVARLYKTRALTTAEASQPAFLRRAARADIIHIAAHAELNTTSPLFYRIRLGPHLDDEGMLEIREVYNLNLSSAGLVVLSACRTQVGLPSQGDDIVALNRAFIYAGTPTVIASLWTVEDKSTRMLMTSFYTNLRRGLSKAEALRAAQTETRRNYPHPYHWAAFVLTGDPGLPPAATNCNGRQAGKGRSATLAGLKGSRPALGR